MVNNINTHDLFLLMLNLSQVRSEERIKVLFINVLNSFCSDIHFEIIEEDKDDIKQELIPISTAKNSFGFLLIKGKQAQLSDSDLALIRNSAVMLAIILENILQDKFLSEEKEHLSVLVDERTVELEEKNEQLERIIEERIKIDTALLESREQFKTLMQQSPLVIEIYDLNGLQVAVNKAYEKLWGFEASETVNSFNVLKSKEVRDRGLMQYLKRAYAGESVVLPEYEFDLRGETEGKGKGRVRWLSTRIYPLKDIKGKVKNITIMHEDITERKNYEIQLQEKNDEILAQNEEYREINEELIQAKEQAEESDHLKSTFLAIMSHEIRTPLNSILGYSDLMLADELSKEHRGFLEAVYRSGKLLLTIINDILDLSTIEADKVKIKKAPFSLKTVLNNVIEHAQLLADAKAKNIDLILNVEDEIVDSIIGDAVRIQQVLNNLLDNAIKFTEQGSIELSVCLKNDKYLELFVKDTGIGVPSDKSEKVFDIFTQLDMSDTRKYGGVGLGLSISKKLVHLMGGEISIASSADKDQGMTISFTLLYQPCKKSEYKLAQSIQKTFSAKGSGMILVVDDDAPGKLLIQKILSRAHYDVLLAKNGQEAIDIYKARDDIALIFMDIQMPVLDGFRATVRIRELEKDKGKNVAIVALTAAAMKGDQKKCLAVGCDDYLSKPFDSVMLLEKVTSVFSRK